VTRNVYNPLATSFLLFIVSGYIDNSSGTSLFLMCYSRMMFWYIFRPAVKTTFTVNFLPVYALVCDLSVMVDAFFAAGWVAGEPVVRTYAPDAWAAGGQAAAMQAARTAHATIVAIDLNFMTPPPYVCVHYRGNPAAGRGRGVKAKGRSSERPSFQWWSIGGSNPGA